MSERRIDQEQAGDSPVDAGKSKEQLEGSPKSFSRYGGGLEPVENPEELEGVQGPGGDSRPDLTDPASAQFERVDDDPRMRVGPDRESPEIHRPDRKELEAHRVDQRDEIAAKPVGPLDKEQAVLRPRKTKKGAESSEL